MKNKIKPINEISDDEWESHLKTLKDELDVNWLEKKPTNPVQILWQREDILASQELYILSKAIENLKNLNKTTLKQQIKYIKSKDYNTCKGHCFEVIGLSYFQNNYKMFPTSDGHPGVDGVIEFDNIQMNWSFKNYGISKHQIEFENKTKNLEEQVKNLFNKRKWNNFAVTIIFTKYPETKDIWNSLEKQIIADVSTYNGNRIINGNQKDMYCYRIEQLNFENLANINMSYTFNAISPHHKNEKRNFLSKLDDAVANLLQYSFVNESNKELKNALFVHIPESIDISNCTEWGQEYINRPDKLINLIVFYQTFITQNQELSHINHAWQYLTKDIKLKLPLSIEIPVGVITSTTAPLIIKEINQELKDSYVYQHGDIYNNAQKISGRLEGNLTSIAIGIKTNTVFKLPDKGTLIVFPKLFPSDNKLLII